MLLKDLVQLNKLNVALSDNAKNIEVADAFAENPSINIAGSEITILCSDEGIIRAINFNFNKNTITDVFSSNFTHGGIVYSLEGGIIKIIN